MVALPVLLLVLVLHAVAGVEVMEAPATPARRPHIVYILADDLGWNDVGFTGRSDLQTPNMDALAYHGRILTQHYALPTCTPSRTALLTGKYPIRTGMQGFPLSPSEPRGLPLDQKLMPQYFKELGYQTHLVGKWHLGYHEWKYTPTRRGFDTHFGYLNGYVGYYDHRMNLFNMSGHDFWRGAEPQYGLRGRYVTDLLTEEAVRLISEVAHPPAAQHHEHHSIFSVSREQAPLFLLLSHLAPHSGNPGSYHEYPEQDILRFNYIPDENRRKYAAMVWNLDKSVGQVVESLAHHGMLENTIIVLASDNGAQTIGLLPNDGSNHPLKGLKFTLFEGGVRTAALLWTPQLHAQPRGVSRQLFHISDWLPTLYAAAGGDLRDMSGLDGRSQWSALHDEESPTDPQRAEFAVRREMLLNIDEVTGQQAVRYRHWKLISGGFNEGKYDGWLGNFTNPGYAYNLVEVTKSPVSRALRSIARHTGPLTKPQALALRAEAAVYCGPQNPEGLECSPSEAACLFDMRTDPCELNNLAAAQPALVAALTAKLDTYREQLKPQLNVALDPRADPQLYNGTWVPWLEKYFVDLTNPGRALASHALGWALAVLTGLLLLRLVP